MKQYIEDVLNQNFIAESKSLCSSPAVCVRKKDGTLRLYIDYPELNRKTIADEHPIPRVQETLDCLGVVFKRGVLSWVDQGGSCRSTRFTVR